MLFCLKEGLNNKIIFGFVLLIFFLGTLEKAFADAPFYTDDTGILDPGSWQAILYANDEKSPSVNAIQAPALEFDYAFFPNFEVDTYIPVLTNTNVKHSVEREFTNQTGLSDISFEFKYRFLQETKYFPAFSFGPNLYIPTGNARRGLGNGRVWYYVPISAHKTFQDWSTYAEIGYAVNSAPHLKNYALAGWVVQKKINETITLGGEIYSQSASASYIPAFTVFNFGGSYILNKHMSFLASLGHNVVGPDYWSGYIGMGLS